MLSNFFSTIMLFTR